MPKITKIIEVFHGLNRDWTKKDWDKFVGQIESRLLGELEKDIRAWRKAIHCVKKKCENCWRYEEAMSDVLKIIKKRRPVM